MPPYMLDWFISSGFSILCTNWISFYHVLKDCRSKSGYISVATYCNWQVELWMMTWCVSSQRLENKLKEDSGTLPGTVRIMYLTTPSGIHILPSFCRLRSTVRETYNDEGKVIQGKCAVIQAFSTPSFSDRCQASKGHDACSLTIFITKGSGKNSSQWDSVFYSSPDNQGKGIKDRLNIKPKVTECNTGKPAVEVNTWA